jgi:hypothetical protein
VFRPSYGSPYGSHVMTIQQVRTHQDPPPRALMMNLVPQPPPNPRSRKRPASEIERKTASGSSDSDDDGGGSSVREDPAEAIRATIASHFAAREASAADDRKARARRRSIVAPAAGVAEAAETFRTAARANYADRYVAAYRAGRLRDALQAEIDSRRGGEHAGLYWVAAGRTGARYRRVSLGNKYYRREQDDVEPVEGRTLPMAWSEWRVYVTLFGHMERFVESIDDKVEGDAWELVVEELVPAIPWEAIVALAPTHGANANINNFLCVHTKTILESALEQHGKRTKKK